MSRITQEIAKSVAKKVLSELRSKVDKASNDYRQLITDEYRSYIPSDVMDLFNKYPKEWIHKAYSVFFSGNGFSFERVNLTSPLPSNVVNDSTGQLFLTEGFAVQALKAKRKHEKLKDNYDNVLKDTITALINLRTYKRVEENFPEAYKFLPSPSMPVAINLDYIRKKINSQ